MKFIKLAHHHAATSFLNSLFLEWKGAQKLESSFAVDLAPDKRLIIPVKKFSLVGRHQYEGVFYLTGYDEIRDISFQDLVQLLAEHLQKESGIKSQDVYDFVQRVLNSARNTEIFLRNSEKHSEELFLRPPTFIEAEQCLFAGHAFHPAPKSRIEFDEEDVLNYSPETRSCFPLVWYFIEKNLYLQKTAKGFDQDDWTTKLYLDENPSGEIPENFVPYPVHPWQEVWLCKTPVIMSYIQSGRMKKAPVTQRLWVPTSSLRTLYAKKSSYMLKFSLSVKLTNSVRHLLVHELDRGLKMFEIFNDHSGKNFFHENPEFEMIFEPIYAAICDSEGRPVTESLMMGRINPFKSDSSAIVLAALTQDHPRFRGNLTRSYIERASKEKKISLEAEAIDWFRCFLKVAIKPLINIQSKYGIFLGSHQQNMILEMRNNRPSKSYFRDCHGTGYSALALKHFQGDLNVLEVKEANFLFGYYVIINSTFNMIAAIGEAGVEEEILLREFRAFLKVLRSEAPADPSFIDYLLDEQFLLHKGNFFCTLKRINENTSGDPLAIYTLIPNPITGENNVKP